MNINTVLELRNRSKTNLMFLKMGHDDPAIDRNLEKRMTELESNFQELLCILIASNESPMTSPS